MSAYSFLNVQATLTGPGGVISLGYGAGVAEEGITIESEDDKGKLDVGADGIPMHTLRARKNGSCSVRLQKTSSTNSLLQLMYDFQTLSSANWGQNVIVVSDNARGDLISCRSVAFRKVPVINYAQDANMNEWQFLVGIVDRILGAS